MHPDGSPTATGAAYLSAVRTASARSAKARAKAKTRAAKARRRA
jgi:hypothetical protein